MGVVGGTEGLDFTALTNSFYINTMYDNTNITYLYYIYLLFSAAAHASHTVDLSLLDLTPAMSSFPDSLHQCKIPTMSS